MEKVTRQRRGESTWREILERQAQSGLTVSAFCEREGIKPASLYGWRARLRAGPEGKPGTRPAATKAKSSEAASSGFIDLGSLGSGGSRFEVRLELGHGVLLHLVRS